MKNIKIPQFLKDYAHSITEKRVEVNKERYNGTNKQRSGTLNSALLGENVDREYYTDYIGILGELLVRYYYEMNPEYGYYTASTFIKDMKMVKDDVDLTVNKKGTMQKISIKTCEKTMKANKAAMDKEDADVVVFILFTSPTDYTVAHFTPQQVREWEVKQGWSPYYNLSKTQFKQLLNV